MLERGRGYKTKPTSLTSYIELISIISADTNAGLLLCGHVNCAETRTQTTSTTTFRVCSTRLDWLNTSTPTRGGNLLYIIVTEDPLAVSGLSVDDVGLVNDHRLVLAKLRARPVPRQPTKYTYRNIKQISTPSRSRTLFVNRRSSPFLRYLPTRTSWLTSCQLNSTRWHRYERRRDVNLNGFLVGCRRRLSRRNVKVAAWRRSGKESDRLDYRAERRWANKLINESRRDYNSRRINACSDSKSRWAAVR